MGAWRAFDNVWIRENFIEQNLHKMSNLQWIDQYFIRYIGFLSNAME